jgi:hypothetical protein
MARMARMGPHGPHGPHGPAWARMGPAWAEWARMGLDLKDPCPPPGLRPYFCLRAMELSRCTRPVRRHRSDTLLLAATAAVIEWLDFPGTRCSTVKPLLLVRRSTSSHSGYQDKNSVTAGHKPFFTSGWSDGNKQKRVKTLCE